MKNQGKGLRFQDIKHISGCNPLLLSHLRQEFALSDYEVKVDNEVKRFLNNNVVLGKDTKSIERFLEKISYKTCDKYIYYSYRGDVLTNNELNEYKFTWLDKHHVTILDDKVENGEMIGKTLRLNFHPLGKKLLEILRSFVSETNDDLIQTICSKERSFAGFWFEGKFHSHCAKSNELYITTVCITSKLKPTTGLELSVRPVRQVPDHFSEAIPLSKSLS